MTDETFLSRWSRRKAEARREPEDAPDEVARAAPIAAPAEAARDTPPDEETRQRWIAELEKVDIDKLTYDDDFSTFMKSWVPEALRQKALRKLWTTSPALFMPDGLDDWCGDYTDAATVVPGLRSSWLPGKGYSVDELAGKLEELAGEPGGDATSGPESDGYEAHRLEPAQGESAQDRVPETPGDRSPSGPDEPEKSRDRGTDN